MVLPMFKLGGLVFKTVMKAPQRHKEVYMTKTLLNSMQYDGPSFTSDLRQFDDNGNPIAFR